MKRSRWLFPLLVLIMLVVTVTAVSALAYVVRPGDTLTRIARQFSTNVNAIVQANPAITNPNLIYVGQTLEIPTGDATPAPPAPQPPAPQPSPPQLVRQRTSCSAETRCRASRSALAQP